MNTKWAYQHVYRQTARDLFWVINSVKKCHEFMEPPTFQARMTDCFGCEWAEIARAHWHSGCFPIYVGVSARRALPGYGSLAAPPARLVIRANVHFLCPPLITEPVVSVSVSVSISVQIQIHLRVGLIRRAVLSFQFTYALVFFKVHWKIHWAK